MAKTKVTGGYIADGAITSDHLHTTLDLSTKTLTIGATTVSGHLIPDTNITYDLGSSTYRFRDIYLDGTTINLGGTELKKNSDGDIEFKSGSNFKRLVVSELEFDDGTNRKKFKISSGRLRSFDSSGASDTADKISLSSNTTDDLGEGSSNLYFTTARARSSFSASTGIAITDGAISAAAVPNSSLTNSSVTINSNSLSLGGTLTLDTDDIGEGSTNLYFTNARARGAISVSGNALSYNSSTGVLTANYEESPSFTGNITVSGTVDGRDIAADGTKLDGIESGATADQTQSEINALGITATGLSGTPNITVGTIDSGAITITTTGSGDLSHFNIDGADANYDFRSNSTSGYTTTFNMDNTGLEIGHNSSGRNLALRTDSTDRIIIGGSGGVNFQSNNLTSIGTINSGDITTTGIQMGTGTSNDIQADGKTAYIGSAIFGNSASTNVPATTVHIKGSGTPTLRIEDLDSTNQVYDFITNFGVGLSIVDQTSSITPLAFAHTTGNATFAGSIEATSFSDGTISGITFIDEDSFATNSATRIPTQQSIKAYVDAQVAGVVDSAPAALNTLNELAAALGDDANFSTTTSDALGNRLRVDTASQGLTGTQQANAITNLGITATKAELNYVDGVTSSIQDQLDTKITSSDNITGTSGGLSGTPDITVGEITTTQLDLRGEAETSNLDTVDRGLYYWGSTQPSTGSPGFNYGVAWTVRDPNQNIQLAFGSSSAGRLAVRRADSGTYYDWTHFYGEGTTISGDVSSSYNQSTNTLTLTVADDSHNHVISNIDGLQTALDSKYESGDNVSLGTINSGAITSSSIITTQADSAGAGIKIKRTNSSTSGARGYIGFMDSDNNFVASIDSRATGVNNSGDLRFTTSTGEAETGVYNLTPVLTLGTDQSATFAGTVIADDLDISGSLALGSTVTLSESAERADLLEISSSTSGWAGLQIRNTSNEGRWSFMTNGAQAGIYDDENNKWHFIMNENAGTDLYYNAGKKLETTNTGVEVTGNIVVTGTVDGVDIAARDAVLTSTTTSLDAKPDILTSAYNGTYNIPIHSGGDLYTSPNAGGVTITGSSGQISTPSHGNSSQWNSAYTLTNAITSTATELNYTDGVTSNIQTQLNAKQGTLSASTNITVGTISSGAITLSSDSSDMGFGTAKAGSSVGHTASVDEGIFWHTTNDYAIYRTAGAWSSPNYSQLKLKWATGIEIDGNGTSYGKSGINFLNGNIQMDGTQIIDSSRNLNNINNINMAADNTAVNYLHVPRGGGITLYGDTSVHHGIFSRNQSNAVADDILISSYGAVYIDLDSNNNNGDAADFVIGRHNSTSENFFFVDGENGNVNISYDNAVLQFGTPGNGSNVNGCWASLEGNTDTSGEGSGRLFFREHNSSTASMDNYGMSIGYRGGSTAVTTAGGNSWGGLADIGNGQWGMWGHDNNLNGSLIMYGDRTATFVDFAGNNIQGITDIYVDDQIISTGDTDTYIQFHAADQFRVVIAGAEVMEWGANYAKLNDNDVMRFGAGSDFRIWHNGTDNYIRNYNHAGGSIYFQGEDTEGTNHALLYMQNDTSRPYLRLFENGEERLRTTSYGVEISGVPLIDGEETLLTNANAGIYFTNGGTDGTFASHGGIARSNGASFHISGSVAGDFCISAEAGKKILFGETNAKNAEIDSSGNFTATSNVTAYSDERLKDNIQTIENGLETVKQLRGVSFTRNDIDDSDENIGVIAQEVEKVLPQVVLTHDDGIKSVSYGNMAGLFIEAIKEQQELIEKLTARIEELEK